MQEDTHTTCLLKSLTKEGNTLNWISIKCHQILCMHKGSN